MSAQVQTLTGTTTLPCAVCSKALERMDGDPDNPYGANIFTAGGNYGATAYDAPGGEHLELLICTDCLHTMKASSSIYRVLHATAATPEARNFWDSAADPAEDNPKNKQRLRNDFAMEDYLETAEGMTQEWASLVFEACYAASHAGEVFDPASVPAPGPVAANMAVIGKGAHA